MPDARKPVPHTPKTEDTARLTAYLERELPGFKGPVRMEKFPTGQSNPTYRLSTPGRSYVLRQKPPGALLKSAHAVDREFRVQRALTRFNSGLPVISEGATTSEGGVPVAKMHLLCEDPAVFNTMFYIMDFVPGRSYTDPALPACTKPQRAVMYDQMNRVLANLHNVSVADAGLADFGAPGNYFERQIARWSKQYKASQTGTLPAMDALISELTAVPAFDDGQHTLVHGDYRLDNLIFDPQTHEIAALLDWELSTTGHPYADLGSLLMQWRMPPGDEGRGLAGIDRAALGIPTEREFIDLYCRRRNLDAIENTGYVLAFCFFRMASVLQGVKKRALDGNASNPEKARRLGALVPAFAQQGLKALKENT